MRAYSLAFLLLAGCIVLEDTASDPDADGDGYKASEDCDDEHAEAHPGGVERCDDHNIDEDCNGLVNDQDPEVEGGSTYFVDADDDGYGDLDTTVIACDIDDGLAGQAGDCDDADNEVHPEAQERCDEDDVDEDCDTLVDDEDPDVDVAGYSVWYPDDDADGYGVDTRELTACDAPTGWITNTLDCDDHDDTINPDSVEVCDGVDNDCDGWADGSEAADADTWYADADGDGYGDADATRVSCDQPEGFVSSTGDCDDVRPLVHPGGTESCNGHDDDCDGSTDESGTDAATFYADADGDGYGDASATRSACDAPAGYVTNDDDCDDTASGVSPGATETCDSADLDEDCDGYSDDEDDSTSSTGKTTLYYDGDADGYGDSSVTTSRCDTSTNWTSTGGDCDDDDADANPGETEICDAGNTDEDCDGAADDNDASATGETTWYVDADGDGYGVSTTTLSKCDQPSGYSQYNTDCDDADSARDPGNTEVCDASDVDEDCDSAADDADSSATGKVSWFVDADADGYGDEAGTGISRCNAPSGYAAGNTDCDDADASVSPAALDVCFDTEDTDCDGSAACDLTYTDAAVEYEGASSSDYVGYLAFDSAGDVDSDGYDDLIVGARYNDAGGSSSGSAFIFHGSAAPTSASTSAAYAAFTGEDASDYAGSCVAGLGDFDGDGKDDVAVGAYGDDTGASSGGAIYIIKGPATTRDLSAANYKLYGASSSYQVGEVCAGVGDVNNTGKGALLTAAVSYSSSKGVVWLVPSASTGSSSLSSQASITGESSSDYFGYAISEAGDVNGDGYDDFFVGAYGNDAAASAAGAVYLFHGPVSGALTASSAMDAKLTGPTSSDYLGQVLSGGGDHNNDGYPDLVAVASGYASGTTYIVNGPMSGTSAVATAADASLQGVATTSMTASGDIDSDGNDDLFLGASSGNAYGWLGPLSGTLTVVSADLSVTGSTRFGSGFAYLDHDGDNATDFAIGDYYSTATDAGSAYVFLNADL